MSKLLQVNYEDEMQTAYLDYAMSVIVGRAIPDVRDGLKPVHRRILYAMETLNLYPERPYRKSATVVGEVLGKYHPHGDTAVYEAMVRMAQDFKMNLPLVQGHGNFGSIDGDSAAAMRYTEAKLSKDAMYLLRDLDKGCIDFVDNFDSSLKEPDVLPALLPNLLINGTSGIAVGMATEIPSHNPKEIIKAVCAYCKNEDMSVRDLIKYVKAPDFASRGTIVNAEDMAAMYEEGSGKIKIRSKIEIEELPQGKKNLVVTEIPFTYSGSKSKLLDKIADLIANKRLEECSDFRDESSKEGIRIIIEIKKGTNPEKVINKLYKRTPLEDNVNANFLVIDKDKKPVVMNLKQMIQAYLDHQVIVQKRKYDFLLAKLNSRKEIVEGLIGAYDIIDLIIEIIRGSKTVLDAKLALTGKPSDVKYKTKASEKLASKLDFTDNQAAAILDMRLQKLIGLELEKLTDEEKTLLETIGQYEAIIKDRTSIKEHISEKLEEALKDVGFKRRTELVQADEIILEKEEEIEEDIFVLIDKFSYMKVVDSQSYCRANEETKSEYVKILKGTSLSKLVLFTKDGNIHSIKIKDIPKGKMKDKGALLDTLIESISKNSKVLYMTVLSEIKDSKLMFITKNGKAKYSEAKDFDITRKLALATKIEDEDELLKVMLVTDEDEVLVLSDDMMLSRYPSTEISVMGKTGAGMASAKLKKNEKILDAVIIKEDNVKKVIFKDKTSNIEFDLKDLKKAKRTSKGTVISEEKKEYMIEIIEQN